MVRYVGGPLPPSLCVLQIHVRNSIMTQQMLIADAIVISRAFFIFYLKNPAAFNDDFWCRFLNCFVFGFSVLLEVASFQMPGRNTLYVYICSGKNPLQDQGIPIKNQTFRTILILFTILCHAIVILRIHIYKGKILADAGGQVQVQDKKLNLADLIANAFLTILVSLIFLLIIQINSIPVKDFNCYPNYYFEYLLRMGCPNMLALAMILLYFYRNPKLWSDLRQKSANILNINPN
jgi:hypothetical protein